METLKTSRYYSVLLFFLLFLIVSVGAQNEQEKAVFNFENFELPNGMSGNHVQTIIQDSSGVMWFGSQFGLHRWDGYFFKTFIHDPLDPTSISSSYVESLALSSHGGIWVGTWGGGVNYFDPAKEEFTSFQHNPKKTNSLCNDYVGAIVEDTNGYVWVGTQAGLNRYNPADKTFRLFRREAGNSNSLSYNKCRTLFIDSNNTLWVGTGWIWENGKNGGLNRYNPESENFTRFLADPGTPESLTNNNVVVLFEDSKGNFWVGTGGDGLHKMNRSKGTFEHFSHLPSSPNLIASPGNQEGGSLHTKLVFEDLEENLWVGAWEGGLNYFNLEDQYMIKYRAGSMPTTIPDNDIWGMFQSRDGTLWAWTAGLTAQVFKVRKEKPVFTLYSFYNEMNVLSFYKQGGDILWVGTDNAGLHQINVEEGERYVYREGVDPQKGVELSEPLVDDRYDNSQEKEFENISNIEEDETGALWFGKRWNSTDPHLIRFNPKDKKITKFRNNPGDVSSLSSDWVMDILKDNSGQIWAVTGDGTLNLFLSDENSFLRYPLPLSVTNNQNKDIYCRMTLDEEGYIWIAGGSMQPQEVPLFLFRFDPKKGTFDNPSVNLFSGSFKKNDYVCSIEIAPDKTVWVVTRYSLVGYNYVTQNSIRYGPENFGTPLFYGMSIDEYGKIYLTGDGLIIFDPVRKSSYKYDSSRGLPFGPYFLSSTYEDPVGNIFIGGKSGFQVFHPDSLQDKIAGAPPELIISSFETLDQSSQGQGNLLLSYEFGELGELDLAYDQNVFTIRFAGLDFNSPESNIHEYQLLGYDDQWRTTGLEPLVTYIKVPPGTYQFRVRAANSNRIWSEIKTLNITIAPPWWASRGAYVLYIILAILLAYGLYRFLINRRLAHAESLRLKEFDRVKTQLYTNITHEFRTPLTVILGMARQIKEQPGLNLDQGMNMIVRNGENLLSLVNQMLDLSKLENGKLSLNLINGEIIAFVNYLLESFHTLADQKNIRIHFLPEIDFLTMDYDAEKLQQVISNLVSNAVKFSPKNGHIYVVVSEILDGNEKKLLLKIRDNGKGISEENIPQIFDRFFQADNSDTKEIEGSGIGLALTKELIQLMGGTIGVKSREGIGSEFTIILPVSINPNTRLAPERVATKKQQVLTLKENLPTKDIPLIIEGKASSDSPSILIVEDNPDVVQYLSSCLAGDYKLSIGVDGEEGIEIAKSIIPDLIISDIMMPRKDGYEVCATLKADEYTSHVPIIMLTAKGDVDSKLEGLEVGADAYLPKPFDKKELLVRIRKLLELRQNLQAHYRRVAGVDMAEAPNQEEIQVLENLEDQFVKRIKQVVEDNLDDFEFTIERLCREVGMSNSQLHRKLTALTGLSATYFVRYIRLQKAKEFLKDSEISITAVAFDTGFNDPSYFGRIFKKEFGITPRAWQLQNGKFDESTEPQNAPINSKF